LLVAITGLALVGSVMISYSRARAESLDIAARWASGAAERVVLLIIGSLTQIGPATNPFLHKMPQVLWVLAVLSPLDSRTQGLSHVARDERTDRAAVEQLAQARRNTRREPRES